MKRSGEAVYAKIISLETAFRNAQNFNESTTGAGLSETDGNAFFGDKLHPVCSLYSELELFFSERASAKPKATTNNDISFTKDSKEGEEELSDDGGGKPAACDTLSILDDNDSINKEDRAMPKQPTKKSGRSRSTIYGTWYWGQPGPGPPPHKQKKDNRRPFGSRCRRPQKAAVSAACAAAPVPPTEAAPSPAASLDSGKDDDDLLTDDSLGATPSAATAAAPSAAPSMLAAGAPNAHTCSQKILPLPLVVTKLISLQRPPACDDSYIALHSNRNNTGR